MVQDINANGAVYVQSHLGGGTEQFRYAYKDATKWSRIRCSVILNTVIDDVSRNTTAPYQGAGLVAVDAETGGMIAFVLEGRPTGAIAAPKGNAVLSVQKWTSASNWSSNLHTKAIKATGPVILELRRANDQTIFSWSTTDGEMITLDYILNNVTEGTPHINANRLGFGYYHTSNTAGVAQENAASFDWVEHAPLT